MIDIKRAKALQKKLAEKVLTELEYFPHISDDEIRLVAGVDASYSKGYAFGVATLIDYRSRMLITYSVVRKKPPMPYIPGLLAFREAPVYIAALKKLPQQPDVIVVDGHGLSHPRALGIATHIGLVLDKPSIGVAKKRLYGEEVIGENGKKYIHAHGYRVAKIITHRNQILYISIGYKISLRSAVRIIENLLTPKYKLPLPTALADYISRRQARHGT